jgi:DNA-binding HxlR family transcriptional regulator
MVTLGILRREVFAEMPPRVEYRLTPFGERLVPLLEQIEQFQKQLASQSG